MHTSDARLRGGGFKSRYRESLAWIPLDDGTVSGLLSVQSIRTAVTTFILTALVGLVPKKDGVAIWGSVGEFNVTLGVAVGLALILSLVTTLVATLCLDYSIRFSWTPAEARLKNRSPSLTGAALTAALKAASELADNTKFTLRDKARVLNEIGFYFLMWAIAALPAFFSVYACLASSFLVYVVTWCYYFFPGNDPGGVIKTATTSSDPLAQAITGLISKAAGQVVAEELNRAANEAEVSAKQAKDAADAAAHSSRVAHEAAQAAQALASELAKRIQGPAS
jgi:hypothetical protein